MFTGAQALREPFNRNVFHVRASYFDETERIVQHVSTMGMKKIAVFYQNDAYGKAGLEGVTRALTKRQLVPVAVSTVERNTVDVSKALDDILKAQPDVVVLDVTAVFAQVHRDAVGTAEVGLDGGPDRIRFVGLARLAHRSCHRHRKPRRQPDRQWRREHPRKSLHRGSRRRNIRPPPARVGLQRARRADIKPGLARGHDHVDQRRDILEPQIEPLPAQRMDHMRRVARERDAMRVEPLSDI